MIQHVRNSSSLVYILFFAIMLASAGCKSKKKAMEAQAAAESARLAQEATAKQQKEKEAEERRRAAETEKARLEAEAMLRDREPKAKLQEYFNAIGNAGSFASSNSSINEALALFNSPDAPVLIVISEYGGQKDYDRPTTIKDYLNYLKDQKKQADRIGEIKYDGAGKITELELIKQK
jgi:regulator of protease activity HflC (stomatin/prohibitin superfamily)